MVMVMVMAMVMVMVTMKMAMIGILMMYVNLKKCLPTIPFLYNSKPSKYADCRKTVTGRKGLLMRMVQ